MRLLLPFILLLACGDAPAPSEPREDFEVAVYEQSLSYDVAQYIPAGIYVSYDQIRTFVGRRGMSADLDAILVRLTELGLQKLLPATNEVLYRWANSKAKTVALMQLTGE